MLLAANNDTPYKSMAELIAWSKANPGKPIAYASSGVGALSHLWGEYIKARLIARLNAAFNEAMKDPATAKKLGEMGFTAVGGAPEVYSTLLATEIPKWRKVIVDSKIPPPN